MNKYAYVSLATTKEYLTAAIFLQLSLKRVKTKYPLILMITENLKFEHDLDKFDIVKIIPNNSYFNTDEKCIRFNDTINKFYCLEFVNYQKLLFLDADVFILQNIDDLFDKSKNHQFIFSLYKAHYLNNQILPDGSFMMLTPQKDLFSAMTKYSHNCELNKIITDEVLAVEFLYKNSNTFENLKLNYSSSIYFHFHWQNDYDNSFNWEKLTYDELIDIFAEILMSSNFKFKNWRKESCINYIHRRWSLNNFLSN